jgi:DNA-binding transcriptional MerR regulator
MRIGEVAARTGLTARAIRYYEEVGLLPRDPDRGKGKHRHYDEADVDQLQLIHSLCRLLGTPLDEVQRLVRPELAQVGSDRHWESIETLVQRLTVVETALAAVQGLLEVVGARRSELLELEAALERRLAVIETRPVIGVPRDRTEEGLAGFPVRDERRDPHRTPTLPTPEVMGDAARVSYGDAVGEIAARWGIELPVKRGIA